MSFHIRTYRDGDLAKFVEMGNLAFESAERPDRITVEMMEYQLQVPMIHPEEDFFIAENGDGQILGGALSRTNSRTGEAIGQVMVHPADEEAKVFTALLDRSDTQLTQRLHSEADVATTLYIHRPLGLPTPERVNSLIGRGYFEVRQFYEMAIELHEPRAPAVMPPGVRLRAFERERDALSLYQAHQETFRDHWGHFEDAPFDEWERRFSQPVYNAELYHLAWDGDQLAGYAMCSLDSADPTKGSVDTLGVRRPWRGQGLGMALLQYSFTDFQQRGCKEVALGVDASSKTNAVALYERAGMHVAWKTSLYRRVLRGNPEDIED
jgi:mycothiol synthase